MAGQGTVVVNIVGKADKLTSAFKEGEKSAAGFGNKLQESGQKVGDFGKKVAVMGAAVVAGGLVLGKFAYDTGAKLEAMDAKAKTVFGDQISVVDKWAKANAAAMGLTSSEAVGLTANFADLLIPMGFTREQAAKMATDVVGLSGALSEWSGGTKSATEVTEILNKAMLGETDGLKSLGISISAADVEQRLMTKGQKDLTGAALAQAKAVAVQELIFEKSTDAQTAYNEGTAKGIRAQNEFKAKIGELKEAIARGLYPIVVKLIGGAADLAAVIGNKLGPIFNTIKLGVLAFVEALKHGDVTSDGFVGKMEMIGDAIHKLVGWVKDNLVPSLAALGTMILGVVVPAFVAWAASTWAAIAPVLAVVAPIVAVAAVLGALVGAVVYAYKNFEGFRDVVDGVVQWLKQTALPIVLSFVDYIKNAFGDFLNYVRQIWPQVKETISHVINVIAGIIRTVTDVIMALWRAWGDDIWNYVKTIWNFVRETIENAIQVIKGIIQTVLAIINGDWGKAWDGIKNIIGGVWDQIGNIISTAIGAIKSLLGGLASTIGQIALGMWDPIKDAFKGVLNWIIDRWNGLEFKLPSVGPLGGQTIGVPNIPRLHTGGIIPGPFGVDRLIRAQGGERILPRGASNSSGPVVINLTVDGRVLGQVTAASLRELQDYSGNIGIEAA